MQTVFFSWRQVVLKSKLAATTKHVLVTLGCHMNDMGESCFPSIETLCEETSLSNRAVITHLEIAEKEGFISRARHGFAGQKWARNEYKATFPRLENNEKAVNDVHHLDEKAVNVVHEGSERHDKKAVNDVHTSTSIELSINNTARAKGEQNKPSVTHEKDLWRQILDLGVNVSPANPYLHGWIRDGISIEFIRDSIRQLRATYKPAPAAIPAKYLDTMMREAMKPKPVKPSNDWRKSDAAIIEMAEDYGIATGGRDRLELIRRIEEKIKAHTEVERHDTNP